MKLLISLIGLCVVASILNTAVMAQGPVEPTAEHKILAAEEGTWDATSNRSRAGPMPSRPCPRGRRSTRCCPAGCG